MDLIPLRRRANWCCFVHFFWYCCNLFLRSYSSVISSGKMLGCERFLENFWLTRFSIRKPFWSFVVGSRLLRLKSKHTLKGHRRWFQFSSKALEGVHTLQNFNSFLMTIKTTQPTFMKPIRWCLEKPKHLLCNPTVVRSFFELHAW